MEIWKVGSRWGEGGQNILDIFTEKQIVFAYNNRTKISLVKEGDLIGIADGFIIKFIGKAKDNPQSVRNINLRLTKVEKLKFSEYDDDNVLGIKVSILKLDPKNFIEYKYRSRFCKIAKQSVRQKIKQLWNKY